jgi:hypothetical protein
VEWRFNVRKTLAVLILVALIIELCADSWMLVRAKWQPIQISGSIEVEEQERILGNREVVVTLSILNPANIPSSVDRLTVHLSPPLNLTINKGDVFLGPFRGSVRGGSTSFLWGSPPRGFQLWESGLHVLAHSWVELTFHLIGPLGDAKSTCKIVVQGTNDIGRDLQTYDMEIDIPIVRVPDLGNWLRWKDDLFTNGWDGLEMDHNGDFTIDFFVQFNHLPAAGGYEGFFAQYADMSHRQYLFLVNDSGSLMLSYCVFNGTGTQVVVGRPEFVRGTWYHIALSRRGNSWYLFQDGRVIGATVRIIRVEDYGGAVYIGQRGDGSDFLHGRIDEFRVSKGIARWTSAFTPPDVPYDTDVYTKLLLHFDGSTADSSGQGHIVSAGGDSRSDEGQSRLSDTSKFGSGSAYFDGIDDYFSMPDSEDWDFGEASWFLPVRNGVQIGGADWVNVTKSLQGLKVSECSYMLLRYRVLTGGGSLRTFLGWEDIYGTVGRSQVFSGSSGAWTVATIDLREVAHSPARLTKIELVTEPLLSVEIQYILILGDTWQ